MPRFFLKQALSLGEGTGATACGGVGFSQRSWDFSHTLEMTKNVDYVCHPERSEGSHGYGALLFRFAVLRVRGISRIRSKWQNNDRSAFCGSNNSQFLIQNSELILLAFCMCLWYTKSNIISQEQCGLINGNEIRKAICDCGILNQTQINGKSGSCDRGVIKIEVWR